MGEQVLKLSAKVKKVLDKNGYETVHNPMTTGCFFSLMKKDDENTFGMVNVFIEAYKEHKINEPGFFVNITLYPEPGFIKAIYDCVKRILKKFPSAPVFISKGVSTDVNINKHARDVFKLNVEPYKGLGVKRALEIEFNVKL